MKTKYVDHVNEISLLNKIVCAPSISFPVRAITNCRLSTKVVLKLTKPIKGCGQRLNFRIVLVDTSNYSNNFLYFTNCSLFFQAFSATTPSTIAFQEHGRCDQRASAGPASLGSTHVQHQLPGIRQVPLHHPHSALLIPRPQNQVQSQETTARDV